MPTAQNSLPECPAICYSGYRHGQSPETKTYPSLQEIREERRPQSRYASPAQCRYEVSRAEALFRRERIACLNTSFSSIEEIAASILHQSGMQRRLF